MKIKRSFCGLGDGAKWLFDFGSNAARNYQRFEDFGHTNWNFLIFDDLVIRIAKLKNIRIIGNKK